MWVICSLTHTKMVGSFTLLISWSRGCKSNQRGLPFIFILVSSQSLAFHVTGLHASWLPSVCRNTAFIENKAHLSNMVSRYPANALAFYLSLKGDCCHTLIFNLSWLFFQLVLWLMSWRVGFAKECCLSKNTNTIYCSNKWLILEDFNCGGVRVFEVSAH